MANCNCGTLLTTGVAVVGNQLVLTIPDQPYINCRNYTIRIVQDIPATATMPVAVQFGSTGATLYDVVRKCGHFLYANQIRTRRNYTLRVAADTMRFVLVCGYITKCNAGPNAVMPVETPATPTGGDEAVADDA